MVKSIRNSTKPQRSYPRNSLEDALRIPTALKDKNGGNPWPPAEVAKAIGSSKGSSTFFYQTSAAQAFGLTKGTRDASKIELEPLGRGIVYAPSPEEELEGRGLLLRDISSGIRAEARKSAGLKNEGGDFYSPFWADAKAFVGGGLDLVEASRGRVERNDKNQRLYPIVTQAFLQWWNEKRRWRNEDFEIGPEHVNAQFPISELDAVVKIEGSLTVRGGSSQFERLIYPYFSEGTVLSPQSARIGLWMISEALPQFSPSDIRILDVFRSSSYGIRDFQFEGDERKLLLRNYGAILAEWNNLKRGR